MSSTIDAKLFVDSVQSIEKHATTYANYNLTVEVENLDINSILDDIGIDEAINFFEVEPLLEKIGKDKVIDYFGIEEKE